MPNILLCIGYDGTNFYGYQRQKIDRTVQQEMEDAISQVLQVPITIYAAGRTDRGVHAEVQYINFKTDSHKIPAEKWHHVLNAMIAKDVCVFWSKEVPLDFHARYSAIARSYCYKLYEGNFIPPYLRHYVTSIPQGLDWDNIRADLSQFIGTHDFASVSSYNEQRKSTVRTITSVDLVEKEAHIKHIYITANGFLWKMVRTIVGVCIKRAMEREQGIKAQESIESMLLRKERTDRSQVMSPKGLFLYDIQYKEEYGITK